MPTEEDREALRRAVRFYYDVQKLRTMQGNRAGKKKDGSAQSSNRTKPVLRDEDVLFDSKMSDGMHQLELDAAKRVKQLCKRFPIHQWIVSQKGVSWGLCGVLISEVDIHRSETVSSLWRYAGLGVAADGRRDRPTKGVKLVYNKWLKTKMFLLGECCIKANSPWRSFYDNAKMRKENTVLPVCMGCGGTGKATAKKAIDNPPDEYPLSMSAEGADEALEKLDEAFRGQNNHLSVLRLIYVENVTDTVSISADLDISHADVELIKRDLLKKHDELMHKKPKKGPKCSNCGGTGKGPWGTSQAHRHQHGIRVLGKEFLKELYKQWRTLEGLEVLPPYSEAVLGRVHGDHGGVGISAPAE